MKKKVKIIFLCASVVLLTAAAVFIAIDNEALEVNTYSLEFDELPEGFREYRIAQVSDLHNADFGDDHKKLINMLAESEPDIIVITGDLIDSRRTDVGTALRFAEQAAEIAPCYYITGNHESRLPNEYKELKNGLADLGVTVLENQSVTLENNGDTITLVGIDDPFFTDKKFPAENTKANLSVACENAEGFTVLLAHRPAFLDEYAEAGVDLVIAGHVHGGQFRLPFVGGLYTPSQGFFPDYDAGIYEKDETQMVVSRGIGNSAFPFRINNPPEIVIVELN